MTIDQLKKWFEDFRTNPNYQYKDTPSAEFDAAAEKSFLKIPPAHQKKVFEVCKLYGLIDEADPTTYTTVFRYRYLAQTNLFALCHLLEKYKDTSKKKYVWIDGTIHNTHEEICNGLFVRKDPTVKTFKEFADNYVGKKERLLLVPRGGFKSSIDMADCVQWIICYPEVTLMILTGVLDLAVDFVKETKGHFKLDDTNPEDANAYETKKATKAKTMADGTPSMFQVLFAEHCISKDDGRATEFTTPASMSEECTLFAASIDQNLSGWHVGVMKLDDVVTNENSRTADRIKNINKQVEINNAMLHPYGFYDKIGTWYDLDDTYGQDIKHMAECEKEGEPVTMEVYLRPAWWPNQAAVEAGKIESEMVETDWEFWFNEPGRLTYDFLKAKSRKPETFAIKYLNDPTKAHVIKFPRELLIRRTIHSNALPQTGLVVCTVDTAYSTKNWADYTVIITALIYGGRFYVIDMKRGRYNEYELPQIIAAVGKQWAPKRICIEDSMGVRWLGKEIYREMEKLQIRIPLEFVPLGQGNKLNAKDMKAKPVLRYLGDERLLFANQCSNLEELYNELTSFGTAAATHDDIVSALSILVDQFASYADMEGKREVADPNFVMNSQAKQQYDHIYGRGVYEKVLQSQANPEGAWEDGVKADPIQDRDPLADAGLYN